MAARMTPALWGALLLLSLLWGGSFLFVGIAVKSLPPFTIVWLRVALAALALWAVLLLTGRAALPSTRVARAFLAMGLLNNAVPFSLIVWGQTQIASGVASILNATTPIFTVLVAHWLTADERLSPARGAGVALGFAGVAVMVGGGALSEVGGASLAAQAAVLGAAASYALAGIYGRRFRALAVPPLATAAGQVSASALLLFPVMLAADRPWSLAPPPPEAVAAVLALALLSTAGAYVLYFRILERAGATNVLLVTFLIPPSAILLGWLVLDERLAPRHVAGLALILAGLAAIDGRVPGWRPGRRTWRRPGRR